MRPYRNTALTSTIRKRKLQHDVYFVAVKILKKERVKMYAVY